MEAKDTVRKFLERVLLRAFYVAAILAFVAGIFLERIHTPVWVYVSIFVLLIISAKYADRYFIKFYHKLAGEPSFEIEHIDYSRLKQDKSILVRVKFLNRRGSKRLKHIDIILNAGIARKSLKENLTVKGGEEILIDVPMSIVSPSFVNDVEGACNQELPLYLSFSLEWLVNPIICGVLIPEKITYSQELTYDEPPDFII